jgi:N-acetylglucosaminyl-diphospho-decaprenol L-rhamnosyltransferase
LGPRLLIVIVNYRAAKLTIDCLQSLVGEAVADPELRVVVTDNLSPDDSATIIPAAIRDHGWSAWARFMPLPTNGGFSAGNNAAIRPDLGSDSPADFYLLLNPDTVVRPGAVAELKNFMIANPRVGIAGARMELPNGQVACSAFRFHGVVSELLSGVRLGVLSRLLHRFIVAPPPPTSSCEVDWVCGASMIIRREVFTDVGLLDDHYFLYYEEMDFCLQARRGGWSCWYVPSSHVMHYEGQSSGVTDTNKPRKRIPRYWLESRRRYFLKNFGPIHKAIADALFTTSFALYRLRRVLQRKPDTDPPRFLADFIRFNYFGGYKA